MHATRLLVAGFISLLCLAAAGCATTSAEMLARPGGSYGPTSGADFGLVRYESDGSSSDVEARQEDARMKMYDACNGHYRVLRQGSREQLQLGPGAGRFGRYPTASSTNYVYIKFMCTR